MKHDPDFLKSIHFPVPLIDSIRVSRNIRMMAARAEKAGIFFRPHFKTHQSAAIAGLFRKAGVTGITVSSVAMARYFAENNWTDITLAFPFNIRELDELNRLDKLADIHLLADHPDTVNALADGVTKPHNVFIKIDTGYHRSGILWEQKDAILALARRIESAGLLTFTGILTHAGHSYHSSGPEEAAVLFRETIGKMNNVRDFLLHSGISSCKISLGNTPGCSVADSFDGVDEIRPGNFVFYDLMQLSMGICGENDLALALLCPVCGIYPHRNEVVILGGAVHFSKEQLRGKEQKPVFAYAIELTETGFGSLNREICLTGLSQEHGIVQMPAKQIQKTRIGDVLAFVPAHSCLTADLYAAYLTTAGGKISRINSVSARSVQSPALPENNDSVSF
ncbi:MAG: alanine racemase [Acidobacteria bacterium]|nr:alanine racemase [Acidobacteriota bacterium]